MHLRNLFLLITLTGALGLVGCASDGGGNEDAGTTNTINDGAPIPDGIEIYPCTNPGTACNAHDNCAINPICGTDLLCKPSGYQNCDDQLACTVDGCAGQGKCNHDPQEGTCALPVKKDDGSTEIRCFAAEDRNPTDPCGVCDPERDKFNWSPANGGTCDDGNECTKDDYCEAGSCKGTYYGDQCQDKFGCTEDLCDGKGGCLGNPLRSDSCLINGACYADKEKDTQGCNVCDVATSQSAWTAIGDHCEIDGVCYKPGDKDDTQCSTCDTAVSKTDWTPIAGLCKIDGACYNAADKNVSEGGCGECDPTASATAWTIKGDNCYIDNTCLDPGDKNTNQCSECKPADDKLGWTPLANVCEIEGKCYQPGDKDTTGCGECTPTLSQKDWSVPGDTCLIADKCYQPNDLNDTGCGSCVPATSKTSFTALPNKCLIGNACHDNGATDTTGCLTCTYATNPNVWTAAGTTTVNSQNFETAAAPNWVFTNSDAAVGWVVTNKRPATGTYSLYYGNPATGFYDSPGSANDGTALTPEFVIPAGKKAGLRFWVWVDTESSSSYDKFTVDVLEGSTPTQVYLKDSNTVQEQWIEVNVDLAPYAGKTIKIQFSFDTVDSITNEHEGVYVDDFTLFFGC